MTANTKITITKIAPSGWRRGIYSVNGYDFSLEQSADCNLVARDIMTRYNDYFHIGQLPKQPVIATPFSEAWYGPIMEWESSFHAFSTPSSTMARIVLEHALSGHFYGAGRTAKEVVRECLRTGFPTGAPAAIEANREREAFVLTASMPASYSSEQGRIVSASADRFIISLQDGTRKELARMRDVLESMVQR